MFFSDFHFYSDTLQIQTAVYVLMPDEKVLKQSKEPVPVLYLLHGLSDDHTMWMRQTAIEQYANQYRVCVVMPAVNRSFYMDMAHGAKYETFLSKELPRVIETYFPVGKKREHRFAAGLSMGGYGAFKLGLQHANRYAAVASLSGALDMSGRYAEVSELSVMRAEEMYCIYGDVKQFRAGTGDLFKLAKKLPAEKAPKMFMACGTEDGLFASNENFYNSFGEKFGILYEKEPGVHVWSFWDKYIEKVLAWLPLEKVQA